MTRTALVVSMLALAIAGCSTTRPITPDDVANATPCPPGNVCRILLRAHLEGSSCVVDAPAKDDMRKVNQADTNLLWVATGRFEFCPAQGDGISFITATDQFYGGGAIDDPDSGQLMPKEACKPVYRWFDKNTVKFDHSTLAGAYRYKIQFRVKNDTHDGPVCKLDPWIVNN